MDYVDVKKCDDKFSHYGQAYDAMRPTLKSNIELN